MPPLVFFSRRLRAGKASLLTIRAQSCVADEKQLAFGERAHPARVSADPFADLTFCFL